MMRMERLKQNLPYSELILSVRQRKSAGALPESVIKVLDIEMEKLYGNKDASSLNEEFLGRNQNSVLHRAAGMLFLYVVQLSCSHTLCVKY